MYILQHKNRVIAGPRDWNAAMFNFALKSVGINTQIQDFVPQQLPLVIDSDTKITECVLIYPEFNEKIQYAHGPFWDFSKDVAVGTFEVRENSIESIQNHLKAIVASERYKNETAGIKIKIQNKDITIDTSRGSRDIFVQKYLLMKDSDTVNWKFPEGWLVLTKADLGIVVNAAVAHIENEFNWEKGKVDEINSTTTSAALDGIILSK
jgi:hypothetical protein